MCTRCKIVFYFSDSRPIPLYGSRNPAPPDPNSRPGVKSVDGSTLLSKPHPVISHGGPFISLGDYRFNYAHSLGTSGISQILNDVNKFSAKTITSLSEIGQRHAIPHHKASLSEHRRHADMPGVRAQPPGVLARTPTLSEPGTSPTEGTVPVIVHCGNPFPAQFGFGRKVFPCPQCRYTTDRRNNLKRHMLTMHQTCAKTLECCGLVFATKASLREHAMIFHYHGYTCFYCGRRFCRKALLKRHLSVHNGQKDYVCPVCDYATSHKSNLERHRKVHCRPEEDKDGCNDMSDNQVQSWNTPSKLTDDNNNSNDESSDDEDEEIIVDSD